MKLHWYTFQRKFWFFIYNLFYPLWTEEMRWIILRKIIYAGIHYTRQFEKAYYTTLELEDVK